MCITMILIIIDPLICASQRCTAFATGGVGGVGGVRQLPPDGSARKVAILIIIDP